MPLNNTWGTLVHSTILNSIEFWNILVYERRQVIILRCWLMHDNYNNIFFGHNTFKKIYIFIFLYVLNSLKIVAIFKNNLNNNKENKQSNLTNLLYSKCSPLSSETFVKRLYKKDLKWLIISLFIRNPSKENPAKKRNIFMHFVSTSHYNKCGMSGDTENACMHAFVIIFVVFFF